MSDQPETSAAQQPVSPSPRKKAWWRRYITVPAAVGLGVIVYLTFFSENSITQRIEYQRMIDSLTVCLQQHEDSLAYYRDLNRRLFTDPALMEQVVREQYNMKRAHEDVYIMEQNNERPR